jgi:NADH-quinone oxidoreductase subunit I
MYCGICVEVCPFDALHWSAEAVPPEASGPDLVHEAGRLEERTDQ